MENTFTAQNDKLLIIHDHTGLKRQILPKDPSLLTAKSESRGKRGTMRRVLRKEISRRHLRLNKSTAAQKHVVWGELKMRVMI